MGKKKKQQVVWPVNFSKDGVNTNMANLFGNKMAPLKQEFTPGLHKNVIPFEQGSRFRSLMCKPMARKNSLRLMTRGLERNQT